MRARNKRKNRPSVTNRKYQRGRLLDGRFNLVVPEVVLNVNGLKVLKKSKIVRQD